MRDPRLLLRRDFFALLPKLSFIPHFWVRFPDLNLQALRPFFAPFKNCDRFPPVGYGNTKKIANIIFLIIFLYI